MVVDRPEIPLHTNGSENDVRCHVTRRKLSGGTRSDIGRDCRDAFLGIVKTCAKLEIAFWDSWAHDWPSRAAKPSHRCLKSSLPEPAHPDGHGFCPSYRNRSGGGRAKTLRVTGVI
jgi:hypothetical protein